MVESIKMSQEKKEKILQSYYREEKLTSLPSNKQKREVVLENISKIFEAGREYNEREVNAMLLNIYDDVFLIRRELVEWDFVKRTRDGRCYWLNLEKEEM